MFNPNPSTHAEPPVPTSLKDLLVLYPTDEECLAWTAGLDECPHCGGRLWWKPKKNMWRCKDCSRDVTLGAQTALGESHVPLPVLFEAAWRFAENTPSARNLAKVMCISRTTTQKLLKVFRDETRHWAEHQLLEGDVEVDETFLGWNGKKGRASKPAVMILAERDGAPTSSQRDATNPSSQILAAKHVGPASQQRVVAVRMGSYTKARTCERLVLKHVKTGSNVYTDAWPGYAGLNWFGYNHKAVNISKASAPAHVYLPAAHNAINQLKQNLKTYSRHPTDAYFPLYLAEWSWRYSNRNETTGERWTQLIGMINERRVR